MLLFGNIWPRVAGHISDWFQTVVDFVHLSKIDGLIRDRLRFVQMHTPKDNGYFPDLYFSQTLVRVVGKHEDLVSFHQEVERDWRSDNQPP